MARVCELCGKGTVSGYYVPRKGLPKKKGGAGQHIGVRTKRVFRPNLLKVKVNEKGSIRTIKICTRCLRTGNFVKVV